MNVFDDISFLLLPRWCGNAFEEAIQKIPCAFMCALFDQPLMEVFQGGNSDRANYQYMIFYVDLCWNLHGISEAGSN